MFFFIWFSFLFISLGSGLCFTRFLGIDLLRFCAEGEEACRALFDDASEGVGASA